MKLAPVILAVGAVILAGGLLLISLWRQAEEQVVPESLETLEQARIGVWGREIQETDNIVLPGEWRYWPKVVYEKVELWLTSNEKEKVMMMINMGGERAEMADQLMAEGKLAAGIKTLNKGVRYLEQASERLGNDTEESDARLYWGKIYAETLRHEQVLETRPEIQGLASELVEDILRRLQRLEEEAAGRLKSN